MTDLEALIHAVKFAADRHRDQRRKDPDASPYINHPIEVAEVLVRVGGVRDVELIQAAILHDTIEDTEASGAELEATFSARVRALVEEVSDDKSLPKAERKRLQIEHAGRLSPGAKQIKLADKICNVRDVAHASPTHWEHERRAEYLRWSEQVVAGCIGSNAGLEAEFSRMLAAARAQIAADACRDLEDILKAVKGSVPPDLHAELDAALERLRGSASGE